MGAVRWSLTFTRASSSLLVFILRSHWLHVIVSFVLMARCAFLTFGFTTLGRQGLQRR